MADNADKTKATESSEPSATVSENADNIPVPEVADTMAPTESDPPNVAPPSTTASQIINSLCDPRIKAYYDVVFSRMCYVERMTIQEQDDFLDSIYARRIPIIPERLLQEDLNKESNGNNNDTAEASTETINVEIIAEAVADEASAEAVADEASTETVADESSAEAVDDKTAEKEDNKTVDKTDNETGGECEDEIDEYETSSDDDSDDDSEDDSDDEDDKTASKTFHGKPKFDISCIDENQPANDTVFGLASIAEESHDGSTQSTHKPDEDETVPLSSNSDCVILSPSRNDDNSNATIVLSSDTESVPSTIDVPDCPESEVPYYYNNQPADFNHTDFAFMHNDNAQEPSASQSQTETDNAQDKTVEATETSNAGPTENASSSLPTNEKNTANENDDDEDNEPALKKGRFE